MSEEKTNSAGDLDLNTLLAYKVGMTSYLDDKGDMHSATLLRYEPWVVTQLKTKETDGYTAVQVSSGPLKSKRATTANKKHAAKAGFENGVRTSVEIRLDAIPEGVTVGSKLNLNTVKAGDTVKLTSRSKGKGFAGVVRRYKVAGGPASHGSGFHRSPGSSGNRTWPGRVMPGKKFPGHMGFKNVTLPRVKIMDVVADENVIVVMGPVPGARNTLVKLTKV